MPQKERAMCPICIEQDEQKGKGVVLVDEEPAPLEETRRTSVEATERAIEQARAVLAELGYPTEGADKLADVVADVRTLGPRRASS